MCKNMKSFSQSQIFLSLFFALLCALFSLDVHAQSDKVTIKRYHVAVKTVLNDIESQTHYLFIYGQEVNVSRKVTVNVKNQPVSKVLHQLFGGQHVKYSTKGDHIVLSVANVKPTPDTGQSSSVSMSGRNVKASGLVVDAEGEPIIGATIKRPGTSTGTITDVDGHFSIDVPEGSILQISYIGYEDREVKASANMNIMLKNNVENLNEVVVVGYGTMKKKDLTGAVAAVSSKTIEERHSTNISTALQGAVSGLSVTRTSGEPGSTGTLRLRGVTTIGTSDPLVIIDGVPGDLDMVNPNDVEQISVLKDAASAAIYGSRAAAGVILIQTKRGAKGDLQLSYNYEYAYQSPTAKPEYVNAVQFMKMANELQYNDNQKGGQYQAYAQNIVDNYAQLRLQNPDLYGDTNWYDEILKSGAPRQTHSVGLLAGGDKVRSKVSLRYDRVEGLYANLNQEYYTTRLNNDFYFNKFIEAHVDANFRLGKTSSPNFSPYGRTPSAALPPVYSARWSDGRLGDVKDGNNPLAWMSYDAGRNHTDRYHIGFKGEVDVKPMDGLRVSFIVAPNFEFYNDKTFNKKLGYTHLESPNTISGYYNPTTSLTEQRNKNRDFITQILLNYTKSFGLHDFNVLAGYENYHYRYDNMSGSGDHFELTSYPYFDLAPRDYQSVTGNAQEYAYRSVFGRLNWDYANKYLFEFNLRHDGSSRFASNNRWATFPSFSLGWVLSEEKFMNSTRNWLDQLKLRASWGKLGNERIGSNYPYQSSIDFSSIALQNGGQTSSATSASQTTYAVRDITWETTSSWNFGIDAAFLNSRLMFTFDLYRKKTSDMLLPVQIPMFLGYENPNVNAGDMHTNGWDMELGWNDRKGGFTYGIHFNLSNSVSKMGNLNGTVTYGDDVITREGTEYRQFYGYRSLGIYQTQEEVDNSPKLNNNIKVGDLQYEDISGPDGVPDGKISAEYDRVPLKSSLPHFIYGLTASAGWKGFDASLVIQGVGSQWARITDNMATGYKDSWYSFPKDIVGKYWSSFNTDEQNATAKYPRLTNANVNTNFTMSDFWLFNNRYLRLKNVTIGYTLPETLTNKFFVKKLRFYISGNDLLCINNCPSGWDPESLDTYYPIMKSLMFGVNVNF